MPCPLFVDYTRECQDKIAHLPADTFGYCVTEKYPECPFYLTINNIGEHCRFLDKCPAYQIFQTKDFVEFVVMTKSYCLSAEHNKCKRFQLRQSGQMPPENMLPDGSAYSG